jgi:predicted RNA binding protein YcfA (HicA-like mRNA interferase family)
MNFRELLKLIEKDGWRLSRQKGSHRQFHHPEKKGTVTIAYHSLSDDVPAGTMKNILKQAEIKR